MGAEAGRGGESAGYEYSCLTTWDVGSQDKIRYAWRHYQRGSDGLIYVVDDADRDRIEGAKEELDKTLKEDEMRDTPAMVLSHGAGPA